MLRGRCNALGIRLGDLGRLEEALAAAEKAVGHYRALAEAYPEVFDPYFPLSLTNLAGILEQELPQRTRSEQAESGARLATIQPDLISEAAIIESFTGEASRESEAAECRAYAFAGEDAARVLFRLLQDFAYALEDESATEQERETARRLMDWLLNLARQVEDHERCLPLVRALPIQTTILLVSLTR